MKTKLISLAVLLLSAFAMKAQQGEIIYRDFEPDSTLKFWSDIQSMTIDLDGEGSPDIELYYLISGGLGEIWPHIYSLQPDVIELCAIDSIYVIPNNEAWVTDVSKWVVRVNDCYAFRYKHNDGYLYGWFETFKKEVIENGLREVYWGVDRVAFCTIQDYPLVWGQTNFTGIYENDNPSTFITIHPNPTTGLITIAGNNLRQAEVLNMLGQQVLNVQGEGNELRIDMAALPAGVYFVNITDGEGRRCVRKVVKK
jgi:hypothetical protein